MMGSGSFWARAGLGVVLAGSFALAACQPLYGGKPEKLVAPSKKGRPKDAPEVASPYKDVEDCKADFHGDSKVPVRPQPELSRQLVQEGDTAMANADHATDPGAQGGLLKEGVERYRNALLRDPFSPEATLKLALAYDRVYRKGCAIAMLKRLASLQANPKFAKGATAAIDSMGDNAQWFKRYRRDADAAVGR
jgi:hypothetical protein